MKKIKIVKHVEITYVPDEALYSDMPIEQIAEEDMKIITEYGQSFLVSAEGDIDEQVRITWEIIEEDAKKEN